MNDDVDVNADVDADATSEKFRWRLFRGANAFLDRTEAVPWSCKSGGKETPASQPISVPDGREATEICCAVCVPAAEHDDRTNAVVVVDNRNMHKCLMITSKF